VSVYVWKARTLAGEVQSGELDADNETAVVGHLRKNRLVSCR
jgi:type II secretory pathway component PulF